MNAAPASALRLDFVNDKIARVTFDQPGAKVNTLHSGVLAEFEKVLSQLEGQPQLEGLILCSGKPGTFIAGADLRELAQAKPGSDDARGLILRGLNVIARFEKLPCPTVALIDGACLGGGLEVALGFDYRLASNNPKTDIGLPETKIGLIPGWGGTQRLTRLIGPSQAAELICAGESVKADRARQLGIVFDAVPASALLEEALRLLAWSRQTSDWQQARKHKEQPVGLTEDQASFAFAVARAQVLMKTKGQYPAPLAALEAIAGGCNLTLSDGLKVETAKFLPLVGGTISRNLIAIFFMNQRLQKDPGIADATVQPRPVQRVGVVGAGIMGAGIAGAHIRRGVPATMVDVSDEQVAKGLAAVTKVLQTRIEIGRMTPVEAAQALALLNKGSDPHLLLGSDVVIEAVVENEKIKTELYRKLQDLVPENTILASNTSTISITRMAEAVRRPENFAGMHYFNPVDRMQLVEVIRGARTSDATVATLVALAKKLGKTPIVVRDCPGFLVNRILFPYLNEALLLLEEGAEPRALDKAATDFGMPMGPITLNDVVGLDTSLYAGKVVGKAYAERAAQPHILDDLVAAGRLGQKSGAGFYSYAKGSRGSDDPTLAAFLAKHRKAPRSFSADEITDRLFLPMLVEASRTLSEGIVREAADVDMGLLLGIGFPSFRGGILRWADTIGLDKIVAKLKQYEPLGKRFEATEPMRQLAASGKGFYAT
jgi:3-hydroxyacyl-CoA dehydrogenase/enoyl-CoA hydratase/3-hydroxybutyryl-CoA epimerase/3-hydroxyacyl-CoA dehydrogenase/enoyl-CoA hydratase/3-hydroxybutyryl-CoA epimerase/enoyl-CoA isomerase